MSLLELFLYFTQHHVSIYFDISIQNSRWGFGVLGFWGDQCEWGDQGDWGDWGDWGEWGKFRNFMNGHTISEGLFCAKGIGQ